jgi:hypothetical protein
MTPLHSTLKRSVIIGRDEYVLTLTRDGMKLTLKGKRNGIELKWADLVAGEAALAIALRASVGAIDLENKVSAGKPMPGKPPKRRPPRGGRPAPKRVSR